jgi:hypothetical protein
MRNENENEKRHRCAKVLITIAAVACTLFACMRAGENIVATIVSWSAIPDRITSDMPITSPLYHRCEIEIVEPRDLAGRRVTLYVKQGATAPWNEVGQTITFNDAGRLIRNGFAPDKLTYISTALYKDVKVVKP